MPEDESADILERVYTHPENLALQVEHDWQAARSSIGSKASDDPRHGARRCKACAVNARDSMARDPLARGYMDLALAEARAAADRGEVPVGAAIVHSVSGDVLAVAGNRVEEASDPTAHAELLAIRAAAGMLGSARLTDFDLYVTLEPCPMCAQAISFARIGRLYFGADDPKGGGVLNGPRIFSQSTCHHKPEIYDGIAAAESSSLLRGFFAARR